MMSSQVLTAGLVAAAASMVEFTEALTVVLALGATRSWRSALSGSAAAVLLLVLLLLGFGRTVVDLPVRPVRFVLGLLLCLFGTRWLRKATRRAAGLLPNRDELASLRRHEARFAGLGAPDRNWDVPALAIGFQATAFEGIEVVFIVVAIGRGGPVASHAAMLGAALAFVAVCALGLVLHRPIARLPGNALKRLAGAVLAGLGTFWIGESAGLPWPGGDLAVLPLAGAFLVLSVLGALRLARVSIPTPG